jgi:hypothetical protein
MNQYQIKITGLTPLLMHNDNIAFSEKIQAWCKDPANKGNSTAGDDRTPPWTWIGYLYHDTKVIGMPSDNLMTMLREGGAKVLKKGKETFKKQTQSGIMLDQQQFTLLIDGNPVPIEPIKGLIGCMDFPKHIKTAEDLGFELLVKRAVIGRAKHVRVRPMFRQWQLVGSLTVLDEEMSGITGDVLKTILIQAGAMCGLGDWRPSSGSSGTFGRFDVEVDIAGI